SFFFMLLPGLPKQHSSEVCTVPGISRVPIVTADIVNYSTKTIDFHRVVLTMTSKWRKAPESGSCVGRDSCLFRGPGGSPAVRFRRRAACTTTRGASVPEHQTSPRELGLYIAISQVGLEMVAPVGLGWLLDSWLGWQPWGIIAGAVLGLVLGITHLVVFL